MAIIKQFDKRIGRTYVYEANYRYDKFKKRTVLADRRLIGHIDPATGEIVENRLTRPYGSLEKTKREFYGATYLLDQIAEITGVKEDLEKITPLANDILSMAYYLIIEEHSPIYRLSNWMKTHWCPSENNITSQRGSELFQLIDLEIKEAFCKIRLKKQEEKDYWYFDTTSISSYSEALEYIKWGYNKDEKKLPQLNLGILVNENSGLPFYYRHTPGNISDVITIKQLISEVKNLGMKKVKLACDRGFMSIDNINHLYKEHIKFLIGIKTGYKFVEKALLDNIIAIKEWENLDSDKETGCLTVSTEWQSDEKKPCYLHLYHSHQIEIKEALEFKKLLKSLYGELETGNLKTSNEKLYDKYFEKINDKYIAKKDVIDKEKELFGCFAFISNDSNIKAEEALKIYRHKDLVEKCFSDIKSRLDFRTQRVSSTETLNGKLFTIFISLIILSWLKKAMSDTLLKDKYTVSELLDELNSIERYSSFNKIPKVLEVTKKQESLFLKLGIKLPK